MALQVKNNVNFNGNYMINGGIERLAVAPANPRINQMYIDSGDNTIKQYDGTKWAVLGFSGAMIYVGTVGTGGTVTTLPTDPTTVNTGDVYKVCSDGTYASQKAVIGDLFIAKKDGTTTPATITWTYVPSGNDKFVGTITGDDTTSTFTITHTLASQDVGVEIYDTTTKEMIITDVVHTDADTVTIKFGAPVATGTE